MFTQNEVLLKMVLTRICALCGGRLIGLIIAGTLSRVCCCGRSRCHCIAGLGSWIRCPGGRSVYTTKKEKKTYIITSRKYVRKKIKHCFVSRHGTRHAARKNKTNYRSVRKKNGRHYQPGKISQTIRLATHNFFNLRLACK